MTVQASPGIRQTSGDSWQVPIEQEAEIVLVRQHVRELAKELRFDQFAVAALTTAASELSRNVWVHAKIGVAQINVIRRERQVGLEIAFVDHGPGILDVERVLVGGFSTTKSLGIGLSGTKRLVDEFSIETEPDVGTTVVIRKWKRAF